MSSHDKYRLIPDDKFLENLAIGTEAEDKVYTYLRLNYSYVQDMRYQKHEKGSGPRLEGTGGTVILPDFSCYDKFKGNWLIDVKYKSSRYFTVDDYKFRDYLTCVSLFNMTGLYIVFVYENEMYFYDSKDAKGPKAFNNSYGKSAYIFDYDRTKIRK